MSALLHLLRPAGSTSYVRSVQQVSITIGTGATSNTATITAVDTTKAVVFWGGLTTDNSTTSAAEVLSTLVLTNATTVTATRNTSSASFGVTVLATVVEFAAALVQSVQTGTIALSTAQTTNTATITSVGTGNSVVLHNGLTTTNTANGATAIFTALDLTNATTVTAARTSTGVEAVTVAYTVVEFKPAVIQSVQKRAVVLATGNTSDTDTISSVTAANTLLLHNGTLAGNTTFSNSAYNVTLTNGTTATLARNGTNATARTIKYTVLEFVSGVLASVQRGTSAVGGTSTDATITGVNTAKALCVSGGNLTAATAFTQQLASVKLLNATTVRSQKSTTSSSATTAWEVAQFV